MNMSTHVNTVTIEGNIKSINDYQKIKKHIEEVIKNNKSVIINIKDSISIISSVIGYLNKLVLKDKIDLHINVGNAGLMELFDDLNLSSLFNVKKV